MTVASFVRATSSFTFNDFSRPPGDQTLKVRAGELVAADHWAVVQSMEDRARSGYPPAFVEVDDNPDPERNDNMATRDRLPEIRARRDGIASDLEAARNSRKQGASERVEALETALERVESELERETRRAELEDRVNGGDPTRFGERGDDPGVTPPARDGRTRQASGLFAEQRRAAFATLRRSDTVSEGLADRVADLVERDETPLTAIYADAAADPDYARAFAKLCRDPESGHRSFDTRELAAYQKANEALRALNLSTGAAMLPTHLDANIIMSDDGIASPFREAARVESGVHQVWNGVTSEGVTSEWTAEATAVGDNSPAFVTPSVTSYKATSFVPISFEALGDMALNGVGGAAVGHGAGQLGDLFNDARTIHEGTAFVSGNGTTEPRGIVTALAANTNTHVQNQSSNVFQAADVYELLEKLPPRFRDRARWMANLGIINTAEQFETSNGARLFPGLDSDTPRMLRRPVHEVSEMPGLDVAQATYPLIVGDFSHYLIYDRVPSQLELVPHLFDTTTGRPTGQRGFIFWYRVGANSLVDNAFRALRSATN